MIIILELSLSLNSVLSLSLSLSVFFCRYNSRIVSSFSLFRLWTPIRPTFVGPFAVTMSQFNVFWDYDISAAITGLYLLSPIIGCTQGQVESCRNMRILFYFLFWNSVLRHHVWSLFAKGHIFPKRLFPNTHPLQNSSQNCLLSMFSLFSFSSIGFVLHSLTVTN